MCRILVVKLEQQCQNTVATSLEESTSVGASLPRIRRSGSAGGSHGGIPTASPARAQSQNLPSQRHSVVGGSGHAMVRTASLPVDLGNAGGVLGMGVSSSMPLL